MSDLKIGIIIGSTRPGRKGDQVAKWVLSEAEKRGDARYELIDLLDYDLPHLDEAIPPSMGQYSNEHTKTWSAKIDSLDGFVSYGAGSSGTRAVEHLRLIVSELQIADVRAQLAISLINDFEAWTTFMPTEQHANALNTVLDQLVSWSGALQGVRAAKVQAAA